MNLTPSIFHHCFESKVSTNWTLLHALAEGSAVVEMMGRTTHSSPLGHLHVQIHFAEKGLY